MTIKRITSSQLCPICKAHQPISAFTCAECGAALNGVPVSLARGMMKRSPALPLATPPRSEWSEGEDDLFEGALPGLPMRGMAVFLVAVILVVGGAFFLIQRNQPTALASLPTETVTPRPTQTPAPPPTRDPVIVNATDAILRITVSALYVTPRATLPPTNTRPPSATATTVAFVVPPTLDIPSVTPIPPSPTATPTRGPCLQKAKEGDTLSAMAARCGHFSKDVIPMILEQNAMKDAASLQVGQQVSIPWPTPTGAPLAAANGVLNTPSAAQMRDLEPTLIAGQAWYTILKGDSAISIAYKYNTTIKVLKDLNPEISTQFSTLCDYGQPAGGADCTVNLTPGNRLRVPVPLPTATLSRTPNGSETPTPTPTPTFNAPYLLSPGNNMLFESGDFPVLRWGGSDRLQAGQVYLLTVRDKALNKVFRIPTKDVFFTLTPEIQSTDGKRHEFEWSVGIALERAGVIPEPTDFVTETRTFVWQGR